MTIITKALHTLLFLSAVKAAPVDGDIQVASSSSVITHVSGANAAGIPILRNPDGDIATQGEYSADVEKRDAEAEAETEAELASLEARGDDGIARTYVEAVLDHHNYHRSNHSAANIVWSDDMMVKARKIAATCVYAHKMDQDGGGYGQNIAVGLTGPDVSSVISDLFYNGEVREYYAAPRNYNNEPSMDTFHEWGHMTQVVWKGTKSVGCATVDCRKRKGGLKNWPYSNAYFTVCNYSPPGNYIGEFNENVGKPRTKITRQGTYKINRTAIASGWWPGKLIK